MPDWCWWLLLSPVALAGLLVLFAVGLHVYYRVKMLDQVVRIFEEKPLFIIPRGDPVPEADDVSFRAVDGILLKGCYLPHRGAYRKGVILFGVEFGSNRWSSVPYCGRLRDAGYDVFAFEPRNQGQSETDPNYRPLQWVTDKDVADARAALAYLKDRHDADPRGVGVFGVSKGGSVGLMLAAEDPAVRCIVTDGAFATYSTMVPYMRRWVNIYSPNRRKLQEFAPDFMYGGIGLAAMKKVADARKVRFPWVERAVRRVRVPLFMIHGQADTYIKPEMAVTLFEKCPTAEKQLWMVPKAKHNQGPQVEPAAYFDKLTAFFDAHLARLPDPSDQFGHDPREVLPTPRAVWDEREVAPTPRVAAAK